MRQRLAASNMKTVPMEKVLPQDLKPVDELPLDPCYAVLSEPYHTQAVPTPLPHPRLVHFNEFITPWQKP
jgi:hypothetical protein